MWNIKGKFARVSASRVARSAFSTLLLGLGLSLAGASNAWAHLNPAGCSGTGVTLELHAFQDAAATIEIDLSVPVQECQEIFYRALVAKPAGNTCAFQGGVITLTTPDGTANVATPVGGVPCLGGTTAPCIGGNNSVDSLVIPYTVDELDEQLVCTTPETDVCTAGDGTIGLSCTANVDCDGVTLGSGVCTPTTAGAPCTVDADCDVVPGDGTCSPFISASVSYIAGFSHTGTTHSPGVPSGSTGLPLLVELCPVDECNTGECLTDDTGAGVCIPGGVPDSTPCTDDDGNECTEAGCDGQGACDQGHVPLSSTPCDDATDTECGNPGCNSGVCVSDHFSEPSSTPCTTDDGNECTTSGCDGLGRCDPGHVPLSSTPCDDAADTECGNPGCSNGVCVSDHFLEPSSTPCTDTGNECNDAGCDGAGACDQAHVQVQNSTPCTDTDGIDCTTPGCDGLGACDQVHVDECSVGVCRTPGFWGTHAAVAPKKKNSQNITQAVINAGGGSLLVCGECINGTVPVNNAGSAVEAMCVSPSGAIVLQNARQLTALALNCIVSGFGADCGGDTDLDGLFSDCNNACVGAASTRSNEECRDEIDCFNNGGIFDSDTAFCEKGTCLNGDPCNDVTACADGSRCEPLEDTCHDQPLENESLGLDFEPPGPAGSSAECNAAIANHCAVLPLTCSATNGSGEACCGSDSCP